MNFEDIRPYYDEEVQKKLAALLEEEQFQQVIEQVLPEVSYASFKDDVLKIKTVKEFQSKVVVPLLNKLLGQTTKGLSFKGIENLEKGKSYLFVSTHRDIVLDSALMNYILLKEGFETAEIAIGDNLMKIPWIVNLVKLNKSFIVKRSLPKEDKVKGSIQLSSYLHHTIGEKGESIWIAQKAGRSKDGNDRTNPSLLKMFNLGGKSDDVLENLKSLNICPVSISYEYNPCDIMTFPELMTIAEGGEYEKQPMEDLMHMAQGIQGEKGRVELSFGKPLNTKIEEFRGLNRNVLFQKISESIDEEIHGTYSLMPTNYIAYDLLNNSKQFENEYSSEEKENFQRSMESKLKEVDGGDEELKQATFLRMYANPLINKLEKKA